MDKKELKNVWATISTTDTIKKTFSGLRNKTLDRKNGIHMNMKILPGAKLR
jgi:hypothetical protein